MINVTICEFKGGGTCPSRPNFLLDASFLRLVPPPVWRNPGSATAYGICPQRALSAMGSNDTFHEGQAEASLV